MSEFWELYKHPEWQKKRLEIMERDGFRCRECMTNDKALNVHHKVYIKGRKPWEYADIYLITFCDACHEEWHAANDRFKDALALLESPSELKELTGVILGMAVGMPRTRPLAEDDGLLVENWLVAFGLSMRLGMTDGPPFPAVDILLESTNADHFISVKRIKQLKALAASGGQ